MTYHREKPKYSRPLQLISISLYVLIPFIFMNCNHDEMHRVDPTWHATTSSLPRNTPPETDPNDRAKPPEEENEPIRTVYFDCMKHMRLEQEQKWECYECTFENPNSTRICGACNILHVKYSEWQCAKCTYINERPIMACVTCGADIPDSDDEDEEEAGEEESCPICLEDELEDPYACGQCKKEICGTCYQNIKQSKNQHCPMCRYDKYITATS